MDTPIYKDTLYIQGQLTSAGLVCVAWTSFVTQLAWHQWPLACPSLRPSTHRSELETTCPPVMLRLPSAVSTGNC